MKGVILQPFLRDIWKATGRCLSSTYVKLTLAKVRRVIELRNILALVAIAECRKALDLPLPGEDEKLDLSLAELAVSNIFFEFDEHECVNDTDHERASEWFSENIKDLRKTLYQCWAWLLDKANNEEKLNVARAHYRREYDQELIPIQETDINKLIREAKKRLKRTNKEHRRGKANRIDLDLRQLTSALSPISAAFTVAGFFYCRLYYGHFGIPVEGVFTLSDYLSSSIQQIWSVVFASVPWFLGTARGYVVQPMTSDAEKDLLKTSWLLTDFLMTVAAVLLMFQLYLVLPVEFFKSLPLVAIIGAYYFLSVEQFNYFKSPRNAYILGLFLLTFGVSIYGQAKAAIFEVEMNGGIEFDLDSVSGKYTRGNGYHFVGGNSHYFFVLDSGANQVQIIPKDRSTLLVVPYEEKGETSIPFSSFRKWILERLRRDGSKPRASSSGRNG